MEPINFICDRCKHRQGVYGGCKAFPFPKGIPDEILQTNKHDKPLKYQNNDLVFTPIDNI